MKIEYGKLHENSKLRHWIVGSILLVSIAILITFTDFGLLKWLSLEYEKRKLIEEIKQIQQSKDSLKNEVNAMKYDTLEIEKVAREKYGMIKPNEQIFFVLPDSVTKDTLAGK